jgi:L-ascorbate metabolism protein UlaG (beta-lactamase superfamily)
MAGCFKLIIPLALLFSAAGCKHHMIQYKSNPQLKTVKAGCKGNECRGRQFINYQDVPLPGFWKVLKWRFTRNPQREEKKNDKWLPEVLKNDSMFTDKSDKIVWLGHATFLITINGKNILTDPVFNDIPFVSRLIGIPCERSSIRNIDYVLLTHGHFDHCDKKSFRTLQEQNPQMQVFAPLNSTKLLHSFDPAINVQEAGWYQQFRVDDEQIEIFYMPAFHWYKRGLSDDNTMLWGSFVIRYQGKTFFFMGDSGYNTHFKEIAQFFPGIDYCFIGVGAYKPPFMMKTSHTSPEDAVKAFNDLGGRVFIPMHYGTYDLSDEPLGEPLRLLEQMNRTEQLNGKLKVLKVGEQLGLNNP